MRRAIRKEIRPQNNLILIAGKWYRAAFVELTDGSAMHWEGRFGMGSASRGYWRYA